MRNKDYFDELYATLADLNPPRGVAKTYYLYQMEIDVKTEKLLLIAWLSNLEDSTIIEELRSFKKQREVDW